MAALIVLVTGKENRDFPSIIEAARVLGKAKSMKLDRIRIEKCDGALVSEFTVPQVEAFVRRQGLALQPDTIVGPAIFGMHRPMWAMRKGY